MKKIVLLTLLFSVLSISAQEYVSTEIQNRNLLIEEFTGRYCPNCPFGHIISNNITHGNPDRAWSVGIHSGYFADTTYPNFNTDISAIFTEPYSGLGYPSALLNRSTDEPISRGQWQSVAYTQLQQVAECNVGGHVVINPITRTASITAEVYYTANSAESNNYLTIVMIQDSIVGQQAYAQNNPDQDLGDDMYCHMHVLRDVVTPAWGDEISPTTEGTLVTKTYEYVIPEIIGDPNGVIVDLDNIYFIAFVTEKYQGTPTRPILNVNKLSQEQSSGLAISPYISDINLDGDIFCSNERVFKTYVKNVGSEEINSLKFETVYEGGEAAEHTWTGTIAPDAVECIDITYNIPVGYTDVDFNIIEVNGDAHDYSKTILTHCDEWAVLTTDSEQEEVTIHIMQDKYGFQTTWELLASDGSQIINGGPYQPLTDQGETATLLHEYKLMLNADDCYKFIIYDAMGNGICCNVGDGYYRIFDSKGNVIVDGDGDFDYSAYNVVSIVSEENVEEMTVTSSYNVYPNPVDNVLTIKGENMQQVIIYNSVGQMVDMINCDNDEVKVNVSSYQNGMYFINVIDNNGEMTTSKVSVLH